MTDKIDLQQGFGRKELKKIIRRFNALHKQRLKRLETDLIQIQKDFLTLLPLLLHINHPTLPGFISNDVPAGLFDYHPDRKSLLIAKKFGRSFEYKRRALHTIPIQGLYLMGSIGSIGQTPDSDLDFWLCHAHDLNPEQLRLLQRKVELIEQFGMEYGLEVHFFLMDPVAFKAGQKLTISSESSGSAQHHLLLEEFYRTGILIAGRPPLWWIVPAEHEDNYQQYTQELIDKRFIDPFDWLDFGGMENVPPDEFFGAAHWQLYKGIESPYKAILKILLMESYASDFPNISWLSLITKKAIFQGDDDVIDIDPYVLIYRQVESYLSMRQEYDRLELARRCFYFKVNLPLSRPVRSSDLWKQQKLQQLVDEWQWTDEQIELLDSRNRWKLEQVLKERNILVRELTHSYRVLMNFARSNAATGGIDPLELNLLGRKLYAALERRPGKIDLINPGISKDLHEARLCFKYEEKNEQVRWQLYRSDPVIDEYQAPLKTTSNLVELVAWCHCNGIIDRGIQIIVRPIDCPVSVSELRQLLDLIQQNLPAHLDIKPQLAELEKKPLSVFTMNFINVGFDPLERLSRVGLQLTSKRSDPLSFSGSQLNLAQRIDQLSINTWGEIEVFSYSDAEGLLDSICRFLQTTQEHTLKNYLKVYGFGSGRRQSIAARIEQLGKNLVDCFFLAGPGQTSKYVLQIENRFAYIHYHNDNFSYLLFDDQQELLDQLGQYCEAYSPVVIDDMAFREHPLPAVFKTNRPGIPQLFSWQLAGGTQLYCLDENGALFHQFVKNADEKHLLIQQQRFFNSLAERRALLSVDTAKQSMLFSPEFYRITKTDKHQWQIENAYLPKTPVTENYTDLELLAGNGPDSLQSYTILCGEQEFDYLVLRNDIYVAVAGYILNMRRETETYPVYLTSIAPTGLDDDRAWSTINLLNFKKRLENQVNIAMQQLAYQA